MNRQERTKRALDIGDSAIDYEPGQKRDGYVNEACLGDEELKHLVLDYLQAGEDLFNNPGGPAELRDEKHVGPRMLQSVLRDGTFGLAPGTRMGPYEIIALIGEGGMGEVYKARDTRLERIVAIKVSKEAFSARFAMEARATASINHSNICTLHDVGSNYLVMEYIDGVPLKGPLAVDQVLRYAIQICGALDAAHREGITHRDLKPENILVTKVGVKVLDFGLAKIDHGGLSKAEETTTPESLTGNNQIIGSLGYMSPEQLRGKANGRMIDGRSDIFSFGVVLYELLTGKRLFEGPSAADVIAAILGKPTPTIAGLASSALDRLLQRCLNKDPDDRWQTARDLKAELEWIATNPHPQAAPLPTRRRILAYAPWLVASACAVGLLAIALSRALTQSPATPQPVTRATIPMPSDNFAGPVLSRDGKRLLYSEIGIPSRLWLRMMDQWDGHPVPGTEGGISGTFSPDGHWIAFLKGPPPNKLAKIPVNGGNAIILSSEVDFRTTPYWSDDGWILVGSNRGLMRVSAAGGRIEPLTTIDRTKGEIGHFEPVALPGGRGVIFSVATGNSMETARDNARIAVLDLKSRVYQTLENPGSVPNYTPTGHLVYRRGNTLFAVPFDARRLIVAGPETPILDRLATGLVTGAVPYSFSQAGVLVYRSGDELVESSALSWIDRKGVRQLLPEPPRPWQTVPLSPDGQKLVAALPEPSEGVDKEKIWIYDIDRSILTPLTSLGRYYSPIWAPDGRSITFGSNQDGNFGIYRVPVDSSKQPELLLATEPASYPYSWAPDGKTLAYYQFEQTKTTIYVLPILSDGRPGQPRPFHPDSSSSEQQPAVSPDGKWLAYTSNNSGTYEIYVSPFSGQGGKFRVSTKGGRLPTWSKNSRELFYVEPSPRRLMVVDISSKPSFQSSSPRPMFIIRNDSKTVYYDIAPDGQRFLALTPPQAVADPTTLLVVTNWFEELSRLVPLK